MDQGEIVSPSLFGYDPLMEGHRQASTLSLPPKLLAFGTRKCFAARERTEGQVAGFGFFASFWAKSPICLFLLPEAPD
jgi:hypothetical protein